MTTAWTTSRTNQNFQARCRQWHHLCVSRRSKSASSVFLRLAALILLSFPAIAKASEQDLTSKGQDEGPLVQGPDEEVLADENAYGRRDFDGISADEGVAGNQLQPFQLLRDLADSNDKDFGGRTETRTKRRWSNNEYLRVWGKRDALRKLFVQDPAKDSSQKDVFRDGSHLSKDAVLVLLGQKRSEVRGSPSMAQLEEVAGQSEAGSRVFEAPDFSRQFWGLTTGFPRSAGESPKRKWERNSLRIWGKRNEANPFSDSLNERSMYTNMRRRKWENLPLRVWGR